MTLSSLLSPEHVDLWILKSGDLMGKGLTYGVLSSSEKYRAEKILVPKNRNEFSATRAALRFILGEALGKSPQSLELMEDAEGKPYLLQNEGTPELWFNVSHCAQVSVIALTTCGPIGVDVEAISSLLESAISDDRLFSSSERAFIRSSVVTDRALSLTRVWVCKEAVAKAWGLGIKAFGKFSVKFDNGKVSVMSNEPLLRDSFVKELDIAKGHVVAVACLHPNLSPPQIRIHADQTIQPC
jgi:4'-phosphopantetheinyl transferase